MTTFTPASALLSLDFAPTTDGAAETEAESAANRG
jgi:hypothetical protein